MEVLLPLVPIKDNLNTRYFEKFSFLAMHIPLCQSPECDVKLLRMKTSLLVLIHAVFFNLCPSKRGLAASKSVENKESLRVPPAAGIFI